jgi:hypothetical protein
MSDIKSFVYIDIVIEYQEKEEINKKTFQIILSQMKNFAIKSILIEKGVLKFDYIWTTSEEALKMI